MKKCFVLILTVLGLAQVADLNAARDKGLAAHHEPRRVVANVFTRPGRRNRTMVITFNEGDTVGDLKKSLARKRGFGDISKIQWFGSDGKEYSDTEVFKLKGALGSSKYPFRVVIQARKVAKK